MLLFVVESHPEEDVHIWHLWLQQCHVTIIMALTDIFFFLLFFFFFITRALATSAEDAFNPTLTFSKR